eukprot:TRINITY_DN32921_c0_g1_i1.p2 TRINITY_DN32921_c0_g1~~TRINITY_DN32921_c0_g1_i1.p2  ORF type:complete len:251 (-),score=71.42 TRINITY_DN32921_c0_g1_i1:760-1512(-)
MFGERPDVSSVVRESVPPTMFTLAPPSLSADAPKERKRTRMDDGNFVGTEEEKSQTNKLLILVSKLCLANALQVRVLKSILLEVYLIKENTTAATYMKDGTKSYQEASSKLANEKRVAEIGLPHHWAWNHLMKALKDEDKDGKYKEHFDKYHEHIQSAISTAGTTYYTIWQAEVKYCRLQKCWDRSQRRLELNFIPHSESEKLWTQALRPLLLATQGAQQRQGIAPNGDFEDRIQQTLIKMGASQPREQQ